MAKRDMKKALGASLKAEEQAVRSRFEKAGTVLSKKEPAPREQPRPYAAVKAVGDGEVVADGEAELISRIERRCMKAGISVSRSEILSAGLAALDAMQDRELERLFESLRRVKMGPPAREILTFVVHRAYTVRYRNTLQIRHLQFARKIIIRHKLS